MLDKFKIGNYTDSENKTGVTVILCEKGAVAGVSVRGAAPATRETDLLSPTKTVQEINAVVLSGGSAFGLEASCGVMDFLFKKGIGYNAGGYKVPIVCGASLYDLENGNFAYPDKEAGIKACLNAKENNFQVGLIGAGTGATCGKPLGMKRASAAGLGIAKAKLFGVSVAVVVAINPLGDIVKDGEIIAGLRIGKKFHSTLNLIGKISGFKQVNTTIGCILTDAKLTKSECNALADVAHDGYALAISPSHTPFDGDAIFCMSSGDKKIAYFKLAAIMPKLVQEAIYSAFNGKPTELEFLSDEETKPDVQSEE